MLFPTTHSGRPSLLSKMPQIHKSELPERAIKRPLFYRCTPIDENDNYDVQPLSFEQCKQNILKLLELPGVDSRSRLSQKVRNCTTWSQLAADTGYDAPYYKPGATYSGATSTY